MGSFQILEHTGETGILARGRTLQETFGQAATGMYSLMVDPAAVVDEVEFRQIAVEAPDLGALMVAWLNELIYLFDVEGLVFVRFQIEDIGVDHLRARCFGERLDIDRHGFGVVPKAATYHMLEVVQELDGSGWSATVILDV